MSNTSQLMHELQNASVVSLRAPVCGSVQDSSTLRLPHVGIGTEDQITIPTVCIGVAVYQTSFLHCPRISIRKSRNSRRLLRVSAQSEG